MKQKPEIEKLLIEFLEERKSIESNPFLSVRVMENIKENTSVKIKKQPVWHFVMLIVSLFLVVFMGIELGNFYNKNKTIQSISINDNQIENLSYFIDANEQ